MESKTDINLNDGLWSLISFDTIYNDTPTIITNLNDDVELHSELLLNWFSD